ncbi:cytochrome b [Rhizobium leguminosarum]|uniref:cytochrome b n=1 Tax=Rhizobium leguminosarum TaxID=384 RepID=UPI001C8FAA5B|nr:cytochrome b [Rhizobium leguminosarum]
MTEGSEIFDGAPTSRYHAALRAMHWVTAGVILAAIALGLYCANLGRGSAERQFLMDIHKSLGMTALVLIVVRIPLRAFLGHPAWRRAPPRIEQLAAHIGHSALYLLMVLMPLSGYVTSASEGRSIRWFWLFSWPNVMAENRPLGRALGTVHQYGAYIFVALLSLHLTAVLWHCFIRHDDTLERML